MAPSGNQPHFIDCPSCKALATLKPFKRGARSRAKYECTECRKHFDSELRELHPIPEPEQPPESERH
jgi:hypothetical protein